MCLYSLFLLGWDTVIDLFQLILDGVSFHDIFRFLSQITADYAAEVR
jgi:hypothetical protein